ncbi:MAG: CHAT domain-containing tetratricopeptide repeat protein [Acidobacteriota bacterium]
MTGKFAWVGVALATFGLAFTSRPASRPAAAPRATVLDVDQTLARRLARAEEHRYDVALTAGERIHVVVEQRGIDLVVQTIGVDGVAIAEFQDEIRSRGQEHVDVVADKDGVFTIAVRAAAGTTAPGSYVIRIAERRAATDSDRARQESRRLRTTAARFETKGRFDEARLALEQALTTTESLPEQDDTQVAAVVFQLAGVYRRLPDRVKAASLYERAIAIMDRTLSAEHPTTALARSQLAELYGHEGERRKAEVLLRQALDVVERTLGAENPWYVSCLVRLGDLRESAGDLAQEEQIVRRALAISERIEDTDSVQYAGLLNNLGEVFRHKQDYAQAEQFFKRSLVLTERLLGPDNYSLATALQNLGIVARERKDYSTAKAYNTRALAIRERVVGPDHPDVAHILTNLANIYRATGDYAGSLTTHLRALRIWENAAGPYQQVTLLSVGNIAKTYAAQGDMANALVYQRRSDAIVEKQLTLNLAVGSERQKLAFVGNVSERTDRTISLHLKQAPGDPDAGALAMLVLLQRKGRVLDAMTDTLAAVRGRVAGVRDQALLDQLRNSTARLAKLALSPPDRSQGEARDHAIKDLESQKERIEAELSEHIVEFRAQNQSVTVEAVQAAMPADAALLEFAIFRPFDPKAERNVEAYGSPRYAVYVLRKHAAPRGFDLGPVGGIDESIDALRQAVRDPRRKDSPAHARAVDDLVMRPLRAWLGDAKRLLISADGELNLVPFEALVDDQGQYLIERYAITYLTSGRDLLRMQVRRPNGRRPLILADPLFGEPPVAPPNGPVLQVASTRAPRRILTPDRAASSMYFAPLAASAEEARAIKGLFPEAALLTGARATKATLQRAEAPRILHIASHGFFLQDGERGSAENPLLRSGLALAGANAARSSHEDGILTALEASGLNLWGTKLVTLSACDTGVGEVRDGEGVYGLRRAFVLAGAETVVMSLWPVSDSLARETMVAYYTGLRAGLGRGDALRQAKLAMLKRQGRQHPFYWASFIQSGEWGSLDDHRRSPRESHPTRIAGH